jgi:hypothetical protein
MSGETSGESNGETNGVSVSGVNGDSREHHDHVPARATSATADPDGDVAMGDVATGEVDHPPSELAADESAVDESAVDESATKAGKTRSSSNTGTKSDDKSEVTGADAEAATAAAATLATPATPATAAATLDTATTSTPTSDDIVEPPSKRQKVTDSESTDVATSEIAESTQSSDDKGDEKNVPDDKDDKTSSVQNNDSTTTMPPTTVTPAKTAKTTKSSAKKDGKISTFFSSTNGDSKSRATTPSKKASTPSKTAPKTTASSGTPLKLRLKTKPSLPALEEDHDEENAGPQIELDKDSIQNHPDIAFCVMFRTRFTDLFDGWCPPLSPQEFEAGIQPEEGFSLAVESYLVRVMSLMMNRKKPVEVGKYSNALETWSTMPLAQGSVSTIDAMSLPCGWSRKLASRDVVAMDWRGRLQLLKMATVAALSLSDAVKKLIADKREVSGRKVLSELQWLPLGEDCARNTYWLADGSGDINWDEDGKIIPATEGAFDTQWRLYRQTNPYKAVVSWVPVASSPEDLATLIEEMPKLSPADSAKSYTPLLEAQHKRLLGKLEELIPRTLSSRDRIREAEERVVAQQAKKAAAARAHEYQKSKIGANRGRTRGKRVDYKQLAAPQDSEDEYELKEEEAVAQGHRRTGRTRTATVYEPAYDEGEDGDEFEVTPSPEPEPKPETPRNAEGKKIRYVEKQGGGRRGKGWVYVVEEEIE